MRPRLTLGELERQVHPRRLDEPLDLPVSAVQHLPLFWRDLGVLLVILLRPRWKLRKHDPQLDHYWNRTKHVEQPSQSHVYGTRRLQRDLSRDR